MSYTPPEYLIWKLSQLAFNITWLKNHFREQSFSENVSKLLPRDFDTWNTREKNFSQSPRKAFQKRHMLVYLVFTCYWRQICCTQLSKPSSKLRSWAPLLVYDATVVSALYFNSFKNHVHTLREGLTRKKKKSVNFHTFGPDPPPILKKIFFADLHDLGHESKKNKKKCENEF